jgi:hypothetical protein
MSFGVIPFTYRNWITLQIPVLDITCRVATTLHGHSAVNRQWCQLAWAFFLNTMNGSSVSFIVWTLWTLINMNIKTNG